MEKTKLNFMLYGEGSFLNKGCEAIINTTIKKINKSCEGKIILSTNDIEYDKKFYNDIISDYVKGTYSYEELDDDEKKRLKYFESIPFNYENFEKILNKDCIKSIDDVDICLSAGGDNYCYGEPNWIYTINKEIKKKHKKNVLWCTSLFEKIESPEMIRDLKTFDVIMARETLTFNALKGFIEKDRLMLTPDTAFSLEKTEIVLPQIFDKGPVVGINISPLIMKYTDDSAGVVESIKELINYILNSTNYGICLIPHVYIDGNNDLEALKKLKEMFSEVERVFLLQDRVYNCQELKYIISHCRFLVAARTHASIAGYSSNVPTLVIGYSVKSKGIALDLFGDYENYVIPVDKVTTKNLMERFIYLMDNEEHIKKVLAEKSKIYKEKADNQVIDLVERLKMLDEKNITNKSLCTGCLACYNACPVNAIEKKNDENGFICPEINKEKCISCNKCKEVCPVNCRYKAKEFPGIYLAVKNNNNDERMRSSSGGVVVRLANYIIKNNGVVYGVGFENKRAKHMRIDSIDKISKTMGSKYVQSDIDKIYKDVENDLKAGKRVLFTGTSCQVEGLKGYLKVEYNNLVCVSVICHGVPSPGVLKKYLTEKEEKLKQSIVDVNFRYKSYGWHDYSINYVFENTEKNIKRNDDLYMKGFLSNITLRESCYNCQMKMFEKNSSDIILGDFWGIENVFNDIDDDKGVSAVIINSDKGKELYTAIKNDFVGRKTDYESILKYNSALQYSVAYNKAREKFFSLMKDMSVENALIIVLYESYSKIVQKQEEEMSRLNNHISDLLEAKKYFLGQIELRDINSSNQKKRISELEKELETIYNSKRWKYTSSIVDRFKRNK